MKPPTVPVPIVRGPMPAFHRSQQLPALQETFHLEALRAKRFAQSVAYRTGWRKCELCQCVWPIRSFGKHLVQHRLYKALGLEAEWILEHQTIQELAKQKRQRKFRAMSRRRALIRYELKPLRDLEALCRMKSRLNKTERDRRDWYSLRLFAPIYVLSPSDPDLDMDMRLETLPYRATERLYTLVHNILDDRAQDRSDHATVPEFKICVDRLLTKEQRQLMLKRYRLTKIIDKASMVIWDEEPFRLIFCERKER